jgi:hypothetical protein
MRTSQSTGSTWNFIFAASGLLFAVALLPRQAHAQTAPEPATPAAHTEFAPLGPLDGLQFKVGIVKEGAEEENPLDDTLTFDGGNFSSAICARYQFAAAAYWTRREGDKIHFLAELESPTSGRMVWTGTIAGAGLEGTMRWTRTRWYWTIDAEHRIRGTLETAVQTGSNAPR